MVLILRSVPKCGEYNYKAHENHHTCMYVFQVKFDFRLNFFNLD